MKYIIARSALQGSRSAFRSQTQALQYCSAVGTRRQLATAVADHTKLIINKERLWKDIHHTCQWGPGKRWGEGKTDTGMSRLSLSDTDKQARDWFVETTKSLGCKVTVDAMGNTFAVRPGRKEGPPTCAGSHLDTQPTGGRYDGILGVHAGVEMLKVLEDAKFETEYPIGVINWTNEEGARFPMSMCASGVWAGEIPLEKCHNLKEVGRGGKTMKQELQRIGYLGAVEASHKASPIAAHFELHIEQGPHLESHNQKIGIVQGVQAYKWFTIKVTGRDCHTGTTGFANRRDAMLSAAKMIVASNRIANKIGGLASTGILELSPGSVNTVPGDVMFSLDIRAPEDGQVEAMEREMRKAFVNIASGLPLDDRSDMYEMKNLSTQVEWQLDFASPATKFHKVCIKCVEDASRTLLGSEYEQLSAPLTSGAGHDSVFTGKRVPTTMIFVPCKNGVSHHPEEYCGPADCANGSQVLMGAVLNYDKLRASNADS